MKIIITSTGTARKNSTISEHSQRTGARSDSRPTPSRMPSTRAVTIEISAACRVLIRPGMIDEVQVIGWNRIATLSTVNWPPQPPQNSRPIRTSRIVTAMTPMIRLRTRVFGPGGVEEDVRLAHRCTVSFRE